MVYILMALLVVVGEYYMKNHMDQQLPLGKCRDILGGRISLRKHYNTGAAMNLLEKKKDLVTILSSVILGGILVLFLIILPKKGNKLFKLGLSLAVGGAISNVADRILRGHVIDYFSINYKKLKNIIFNLADIAIIIGSAVMLLSSFLSTISKRSADKATE